jgi:flagellar hook-associated protein 2
MIGLSGLTSAQKSEVTAALTVLEGPKDSGEAAAYQEKLTAWYQQALAGETGNTVEDKAKIKAINTLIKYTQTQNSKEAAAAVKTEIGTGLIADVAGSTDEEKRNTVVENAILKKHAELLGKDITDEEVIAAAAEEYGKLVQNDKDAYFSQLIQKEYVSTDVYTDGEGNSVLDDETGEPLTKAQYYQKQTDKKNTEYNDAETGDGGLLVSKLKIFAVAVSPTSGDSPLSKIGLGEITGSDDITTGDSSKLSVKKASNAEIVLDGASITATSNSITVNGLTINLLGKTQEGKEITIDVTANTDANYEMVKEFINGYNDILKEMNNLYYAASAREYSPLSDDEKEAMTDDQIEKWETKIKDSILRRDDSLGAMISTMKTAMLSSYTSAEGKTYTLASLGITTSSDYTEKGLLHIYGNKDDSTYPDEKDKLKAALKEDPEGTVAALTSIFQKLYDNMYDKFKAIPNVSSANTAFNDKLLDNEQTAYKKRIKVLEDKLTDMENRYYKQFSAMETAMAKLQSQSNALAGLLGTSNK